MNTSIINEGAVLHVPEKVKKYLDDKVVFETVLQEADVPNGNKRLYSKELLQHALNRIDNRIEKRSFLGELDHPITKDPLRQSTVLYKNCSHIIKEYWWDGSLLKGVIETLPYTENGKILSGLALDRICVGFSLRAMGDVKDMGTYQEVLFPLNMVAYDSVSVPSNHKATIQEIRQESFVKIMNESLHTISTDDGKCYLKNYFDRLLEQNIIRLKKEYF